MHLSADAPNVVIAAGALVPLRQAPALEASFTIPRGDHHLIGPNGSGSRPCSTPSQPDVACHRDHRRHRGRRIAYVLQATKVNEALPVTVREVVAMGRYATAGPYRRLGAADRAAVDTALERMQITPLARRHLRDLSGGQRQRVFVAQGIAQDHDLLLLDEPLTGLDLVSAKAIDDVLHEEQQAGRTVVITSHDLNEAAAGDWVILLAGRVVAFGPPQQVLTGENLAAAYGSILHHEGERFVLEDPAHRPVPGRHEHGRGGEDSPPITP
jgi:manganese transport system ATP-binding protein